MTAIENLRAAVQHWDSNGTTAPAGNALAEAAEAVLAELEPRTEELAALDRGIEWFERLEAERAEAVEDAERQTAGMREVALMRAANARALQGVFTLSLARRLRTVLGGERP